MYQSVFRPDLLAGQVHLVTGGGTGIGRAIAHELASLGAHVVLAARREEKLQATAEEIRGAGGEASTLVLNIRDEEAVAAAFAQVVEEQGALHGLVNNAGITRPAMISKMTEEQWREVIDVHLTGAWRFIQAAGAHMILFTTGPGNNFVSLLAPTIKLSANADTCANLIEQIDFDASAILTGALGFAEATQMLLARMVDVASGTLTYGEILSEGAETISRCGESL